MQMHQHGLTCSKILEICPDRCENCFCKRAGESCTQKCSMRDTNIEGSYECGAWYKMDPKYTVEFLKDHAVVTGTEDQACTCDGCNGSSALSHCPSDTPYDESDEKSNYMDIETAKNLGKIEQMRVTIVDDFVDLEKCKNNEFCAKHNCLPVRCMHLEMMLGPKII